MEATETLVLFEPNKSDLKEQKTHANVFISSHPSIFPFDKEIGITMLQVVLSKLCAEKVLLGAVVKIMINCIYKNKVLGEMAYYIGEVCYMAYFLCLSCLVN